MTRTVADFADELVAEMSNEFGCDEYSLRRSVQPRHVKARAAAIVRLRAAGLSKKVICRSMGLSPTTVERWSNQAVAEHRRLADKGRVR